MEWLKNITHLKHTKNYILLFGIFILINSLKALGNEDKLHYRKGLDTYDFENVYFQKSIPYGLYDSFDGQLKSFFGLKIDQSKSNYYPDLNIISDSDALRAIYKSKLDDMIINESIYKPQK